MTELYRDKTLKTCTDALESPTDRCRSRSRTHFLGSAVNSKAAMAIASRITIGGGKT
jgi:hypothetical protein